MSDNAALEVWKVTVDVQKHFNDLGLRVRSLAVAILGAILAAASYALKEQTIVVVEGLGKVSLAGVVLLAALVCWLACYVMDRCWYHRLLQAAVAHGKMVEQHLIQSVPTIGLTMTIDNASPIGPTRAHHRLTLFYGAIALMLWYAAGRSLHAGPWYTIIGALVAIAVALIEFWPGLQKSEITTEPHTNAPGSP